MRSQGRQFEAEQLLKGVQSLNFHRSIFARTLALALFSSMLGFCYSISTQADSSAPAGARSADGAAARLIGSSTLRFLAPVDTLVPTDFDLGDACYGSIITRYITATGGLRPYSFISPNIINLTGAQSTLVVLPAGCLMGSATSSTPATDLIFQVTVTDATAPTARTSTKRFHIGLQICGAQTFKFAHDHLNTGQLGQSYMSKLETLGGKGTVTVSVVPGTVTINGAQLGTGASLESLGFSVAADGTVYGRPLRPGLVGFTAHAVDAKRRIAKDRTNAVNDQAVLFNVEDTLISATDNTFLKVSVTGNTAHGNQDSVRFQAFMNLGGRGLITQKGAPFTLMIGGNSFSGFTDFSGNLKNQLGGRLIFADGAILEAVVDTVNGTIQGHLTHANLSTNLDAANIQNRSTRRYACAILLCNTVIASDMIEFTTRRTNNRYSLNYNIGRIGQTLGGGFQVFDVRGSDASDIAGNPGDAWTTRFLMIPRFGVDSTAGFDALQSIRVRIGTNFTQLLSLSELKISGNGSIVLAAPGLGASLKQFKFNPRSFSGQLITNPLSAATTGLLQSSDVNVPATTFFDLAIDVNRTAGASFSGEDAKAIIPLGLRHKWIDRITKKPGR
jgi:hypothetical protein